MNNQHWYTKDENGEINATGDQKFCESAEYSEEEIVETYDGRLVFISETETEEYQNNEQIYTNSTYLDELRRLREVECYSIINRGQLWYGRLTELQKAELDSWYTAWLNVTETLIIPVKPVWLV